MPIGVRVTLRKDRMYEFLERLLFLRFRVFAISKESTISLMEEEITHWE